ncbi:unnamed protein product [Auanema sp. JU1783]|nr:unnamed protein product [Auanema sp. JU1783]
MPCRNTCPSTSSDTCSGSTTCSKAEKFKCCKSQRPDVAFHQQIVSSCSGAIATALLMTPMDVVKIRLQQQAHALPAGQCFYYSNGLMEHVCIPCADKQPCEWYQRPGNFNGTIDAFIKISRNEGVRSLWSGLSPTLVMAIPATVFYFSVYDNLYYKMKQMSCCRKNQHPHCWIPPDWAIAPISGATARTISVTIASPMEMIRTKMQSEHMSYRDVGKAFRASIVSRGYSSLFLGLGPTILRDIPFSAFYWGGYDYLKKTFMAWKSLKETTFGISFASGALSGMFAAFITTPFDVVKTQRQITLGQTELTQKPKSAREVFFNILKTRGPSALFTGVIPRLVKVAPACAIMIASYDFFKLYFARQNQRKAKE